MEIPYYFPVLYFAGFPFLSFDLQGSDLLGLSGDTRITRVSKSLSLFTQSSSPYR